MKYANYIILLLLIGLLISCKKDIAYNPNDKGNVTINIYAKVRGQDFGLNNIFYDVKSYRYNASLFKFYVSHLSLIDSSGNLQELQNIGLVDYANLNLGQPYTVTTQIPVGKYSGIRFWLGVDSATNNKGPLPGYTVDNPLSVYQGTYWTWNTGYRFMMFEGIADTFPNGTTPQLSGKGLLYHIGTNAMYTQVDIPTSSLQLAKDDHYTYNLQLDVNHLFYANGDTIIPYQQNDTQTTENVPLARKIITNLSKSFSLQ